MTTTINASTSSGLVQTADTSGALAIQTANTTAISITSGQVVSVVNDATIHGVTVGLGGGNDTASTTIGYLSLGAGATNTGTNNTTVGYGSMYVNTSGGSNAAFGGGALRYNTTGSSNSAIGFQALNQNTTASNNTAVGYQAVYSNSTSYSLTGVGYQALYNNTASHNTALGYQALYANTTGSNSTAVGDSAGVSLTTGIRNTVVGSFVMQTETTGSYNTAIGFQALNSQNGVSNNTIIGYQAGYSNTTGGSNTFVGHQAGYFVTTGNNNTIIGRYDGTNAGLNITTSSNYIVLSDGAGSPQGYCDGTLWNFGLGGTGSTNTGIVKLLASNAAGYGPAIIGNANGTNYWYIGSYSALVSGSNQYFTCRNSSGGVYLNGSSATSWTAVSDETRKVIIEPITDAANKVSTLRAVIGRLKTDTEDVRRPYLIAQDVQKVLPEAVSETEDKEGVVLGLSYTETIPLLVAAIKEQQAIITDLKARIETLEKK